MIEGTFEMVLRSSNVRNFRNSIERIYYSKCVISKSVSLNASWFTRSHYIRLLYSIDSSYLDNWFNFYNLHSLSNFLSMQEYSIFSFDSFQTLPKNRYEKIVFRGKKRWSSEKRRSTEIRFDRGCSEVALPVFGRAGDEFPSFPDRLRCPTSLVLPACRRGRGGNCHGGRGRNRDSVFPRQRVRIGDVTSLVSGIRVAPLRVFLALRGGWGSGLGLLRQADPGIRSGNLQHPLDIGGLGPEKRRDASNWSLSFLFLFLRKDELIWISWY